jgi:hypothetical protein
LTGASTGPSLDGVLAAAEAISFRTPYQSDPTLRAQINSGQVRFVDMHLSLLPQQVRYGFFGPVNWAIVEAADLTRGGGIVLTSAVGAANTYLNKAEKILIELNAIHRLLDARYPERGRSAHPAGKSRSAATGPDRRFAGSIQRRRRYFSRTIPTNRRAIDGNDRANRVNVATLFGEMPWAFPKLSFRFNRAR